MEEKKLELILELDLLRRLENPSSKEYMIASNYFKHLLGRYNGDIIFSPIERAFVVVFSELTYKRVKYDFEQTTLKSDVVDSILESMKEAIDGNN